MTFQYIINHLHEPHLWCIVLTAPHAELNIQKKLEQRKPPVIHVFSATPSISIFVPKNEIYDDTRRSCRNYYVLQGIQSNL